MYNLKHEDFEHIASILKGIEGKFLFNINDHEAIREMFKEFIIEEVSVRYSIGPNDKRIGELLVRNYG